MFGTTLIYKAKSTDMGTNEVRRNGEDQKETIRPEFNRSIMMDFQGAKIVSDVGFLFLREIDVRFGILGPIANHLEDSRSPLRTKHSLFQMALQRVYGIAAETRTATMLIFSGSILRSALPSARITKLGQANRCCRSLRIRFLATVLG
jgi:hypothetical protein